MKKTVIFIIVSIILLSLICLALSANVHDRMTVKEIKGSQFVIFKAKDNDYLEADNNFADIYLSIEDADTLGLSDGEFALVTADVTRYDGGEFGYTGNKSINKLISYEIISADEAAARCGVLEASKTDSLFGHRMLIHHSNGNIYLVFHYIGHNYLVYLNETLVGEYENLDEEKDLVAFLDSVSGSESVQTDKSTPLTRSEE